MAKYRRTKKMRRNLRKKTMRRVPRRGGYAPIGPNGGNAGMPIDSYPTGQSGALPDPLKASGVPIGKETY